MPGLAEVYRERARLIAYLARVYPSVLHLHRVGGEDWPVIYIDTPRGQLSWHLSASDLDLFPDTPWLAARHSPPWDGHTTHEKYLRLEKLPMPDPEFVPAVGRIVHYVSYGTPGGEFPSTCRAAIITEVIGEFDLEPGRWVVSLCVLNPTGQFFNENVRQDQDDHQGGTWHTPELV